MGKCSIKNCKIHKYLSDDVLELLDKHKVTTWSSGATDDHYGIEFGAKNLRGFLKDYAELARAVGTASPTHTSTTNLESPKSKGKE